MYMRLLGLIFMMGLFSSAVSGQVKSKAYSFTLDRLLSHSVPEVSVASLSQDTSKIVLLDARETREFEVSHIDHAIHVGYDNFNTKSVKEISKDDQIVVYCSVGYRSEKIAEKLIELGYSNVSNLYGGIFEWKNQGHDVVTAENNITEEVHAFDRLWGVWLKKGKKVFK